ncbi:hypothetical protein AOQ84DRAFT_388075 [Glonium stellatum]|uniref:Ams2/SPT21 N-terminal domain-containing protein n=1 Tax=Glonium stellatum TaxID=574774 RepID=A0A8E2JTZ3_9PEZI|nr:hypothetical protein AOQ84DRAFT_388075 [Glonium stellatum]
MSSSSTLRGHDSPQSMPASTAFDGNEDSTTDIPRRLMRVKVLYTFDDQNKSNCLARLPNALNIPTVSIDETTQVGVIELKTCIQAIVAASPELVAKLGHDYTVYAYDYSEYETPLVGQGMLSWVLASASSTPTAPAHQSKTMITGRVCKNILGLFSNGIKETLEVKLKLVPVPTCLQSEYLENMEKYRSLSKIMPEGFDHTAWAAFLKANPGLGHLAGQDSAFVSNSNQRSTVRGVESIHQMLTQTIASEERRADGYDFKDCEPYSTLASRAASPTPSLRSCTALQQITQDLGSRPGSRASVRSERPSRPRHESFDSNATQDPNEDGPTRKRARTTKANWRGKSSFGTNVDSLRVTASAAASIRVHRPIPTNPSTSIAKSIEPPPRVPTPRPEGTSLTRQGPQTRPSGGSSLRHGSTGSDHTRYVSPYPETSQFSDVAVDSADDEQGGSIADTPMDFPSSPPLMPQGNNSSAPSSPGLPTLPYPGDSGFASDSVFGRDDDGDTGREIDGSGLPVQAPPRTRAKVDRSNYPWTTVVPGPPELLPTKMPPRSINSRQQRTASTTVESFSKALFNHEAGPSPSSPLRLNNSSCLAPCPHPLQEPSPNASMTSSTFAFPSLSQNGTTNQPVRSPSTAHPVPRKRPTAPKSRGLPRSQTWSGETQQEFYSDVPSAPVGEDIGTLPQPRSGSGARRSNHIKEKLESSVAAGQMPPYCHNCGEIQTPTWRKAYTRLEQGSPDDLETSSEEYGIVGFEIVKGGDGEDILQQYRIFKQSLTSDERDSGTFQMLQLCNPCGLWFNKKGSMRPPEIWEKAAEKAADKSGEKIKRKRTKPVEKVSRKRRQGNQTDSRFEASQEPPSSNFTNQLITKEAKEALFRPQHQSEPSETSRTTRPRASSVQPSSHATSNTNQLDDTTAVAALRRAIQSSPAGFLGTKHSPIELEPDLTPTPTRRLLFPSPRKEGEIKTLGDLAKSESLKLIGTGSTSHKKSLTTDPDSNGLEENDKENCPPLLEGQDDLAHLFEDHETITLQTTPRSGHSFSELLKTPTPKSGRNTLTPRRFPGTSGDLLGFDTPSRGMRGGTLAPMTPFTAQLNQLLSDGLASSPSHGFDFSAFSTFDTPGKRGSTMQFGDFTSDDFLSSDMPLPSSPPHNMFSLYEDPATSTAGLWSGTSIFDGSDPIQAPRPGGGQGQELFTGKVEASVDFAAIIEEVVGTKASDIAAASTATRQAH